MRHDSGEHVPHAEPPTLSRPVRHRTSARIDTRTARCSKHRRLARSRKYAAAVRLVTELPGPMKPSASGSGRQLASRRSEFLNRRVPRAWNPAGQLKMLAAAIVWLGLSLLVRPSVALEVGAAADGEEWDFVARIGQSCSAVTLPDGLVLFAAHCGIRNSQTLLTHLGETLQLTDCREPDDWSLSNGRDMAICAVESARTHAVSHRLATSDELQLLKEGAPLLLLGYGSSSNMGQASWGRATLARNSTGLMIQSDPVGVCPGDSGGPVLADINGERLIVGIISARPKQTVPCSPGITYAVRSDVIIEWKNKTRLAPSDGHDYAIWTVASTCIACVIWLLLGRRRFRVTTRSADDGA